MSFESPCNRVQESLAWSRELSEEDQKHVLGCSQCNRVATEAATLDAIVVSQLDPVVPENFAEKVMARISNEMALPLGSSRSERFFDRLSSLLSRESVQVAMAPLGFVFAIGNLIRFVFAVLLPAG